MLNFYLQPEKSNWSPGLGQGLPLQGTRAPTRMKSRCAGQRRKWGVECNLEEFGWTRVLATPALDLRPDSSASLSVSAGVSFQFCEARPQPGIPTAGARKGVSGQNPPLSSINTSPSRAHYVSHTVKVFCCCCFKEESERDIYAHIYPSNYRN